MDEPCGLRELLDGLEEVVLEETRVIRWDAVKPTRAESPENVADSELMDVATLLAQIDADLSTDGMAE